MKDSTGQGAVVIDSGSTRLAVLPNGSHEVHLAQPNRKATLVSHSKLREASDGALRQFGIGQSGDLVYDRATATFHAGGKVEGNLTETAVADITMHYRQIVDGIPVIMGTEGHVRVTVDPSGKITRIVDNTRPIQGLAKAAPDRAVRGVEDVLRTGTEMLLRRLSANGGCTTA